MRWIEVVLLGLGVMAGCRVEPQPTPLGELNQQQARGHTVFQAHCAVCHNDRKNEPLQGPAMVGIYKKPVLPSGAAATDERVTATIKHGRRLMPAMGDTLEQQDLEDLLAYMHTL